MPDYFFKQSKLLLAVLGYEQRAYWRGFARAGLRAGNQGIILIIGALVLGRYLMVLRTAALNVSRADTALLEALLGVVFLAWLFPVAGIQRDSFSARKWSHLPLAIRDRFIIHTLSLMIPPIAWLILLGSLAICYPLSRAPRPQAAVVAGFLFITMSWLIGITISRLITIPIWRKLLWLVLLLLISAFIVVGQSLKSFTPLVLVTGAATGSRTWFAILTLVMLTVLAGVAAYWSFRVSLIAEGHTTLRRRRFVSLILPGRLGGLVGKDFRYFRRLLDFHLGFAVTFLAHFYLINALTPSLSLFSAFLIMVFLANAALAFNSFGLDTQPGLSRYTIIPVSGRSILLSKNLAYVMVLSVQVVPMLFLAAWRLGIGASLLGLLEALALASAYLTWGNWMSVTHPLKMHFYRFANSGAALADAIAGIFFGSLPGILIIYFLNRLDHMAGPIALLLLLHGVLYWFSLVRFGGRFESRRELVAQVLS
jgi:hypothetical protein